MTKSLYYRYSNNVIGDGNDTYMGTRAKKLGEMLLFQDARDPGNRVDFIAFVNSFSQNFTSNWNEVEALGRMDNIATFKNTTRTLSVGWDVPAPDYETAKENLNRCNALVALLYPTYTEAGVVEAGSYIMSKPPLVRVKYANLITTPDGGPLLGYITSLSWAPVLEMGSFHDVKDSGGNIYPRTITITVEFTVLHEAVRKGIGPTGYYNTWQDADKDEETGVEGKETLTHTRGGLRPSGNYIGRGGAGNWGSGWPFGGLNSNNRTEATVYEIKSVAAGDDVGTEEEKAGDVAANDELSRKERRQKRKEERQEKRKNKNK